MEKKTQYGGVGWKANKACISQPLGNKISYSENTKMQAHKRRKNYTHKTRWAQNMSYS